MRLLKRYQGTDSKIDACRIKANPGNWTDYWKTWMNAREYLEGEVLKVLESMLSTRLTDETYRGLVNFLRATIPDTPIDDIEKALVSKKERKLY